MLLLSLGLHAAVAMIVQPRRFPPVSDVIVISARLLDQPSEPTPVDVTPAPPVTPQPAVAPAKPTLPAPEPVAETPAAPPKPAPKAPAEPASAQPVAEVVPTPAMTAPQQVSEVEPRPAMPASQPDAASFLPAVPVLLDANWYVARQLDVQPRATVTINPAYPRDALRRGLEGSVKLKLRIDEFGEVREVAVEEGNPSGVFDESALEAFRNARFEAARKDGRPVRALIYIRVRYELSE